MALTTHTPLIRVFLSFNPLNKGANPQENTVKKQGDFVVSAHPAEASSEGGKFGGNLAGIF